MYVQRAQRARVATLQILRVDIAVSYSDSKSMVWDAEVDVKQGRKATVVFVPYRAWKSVKKVPPCDCVAVGAQL